MKSVRPVFETLHIPQPDHYWIRTADWSRGMGAKKDEKFLAETVPVDQTGDNEEDEASCRPAGDVDPRWKNVDRRALDREMAPGTDLGRWSLFRNCQTGSTTTR